MISFHNIHSIAKYECKTLFRSWFFRIFSVLSLLVLFSMNFDLVILNNGSMGWAIRCIPSSIPYFNLLILNVAQAIIAVFLASDFLKRDKKLDTTEVIYMRSMTNGEYVIGKTWGNLQVFFVLNCVIILMALICNIISQETTISWQSYIIYFILISVPTLIFIMGISFLLMSIIKNQAITFVIILGYIGLTLFWLQSKYYYIFDYMAYNIPMLKSAIIGMGNFQKILIHRGIYLSFGIGSIFLTIFLLKRLPQSGNKTIFNLLFSLLFFFTGSYLCYVHINKFKTDEKERKQAIELNNKYGNNKLPSTLSHSIILEHHGSQLSGKSELILKNNHTTPIGQLIFSLNQGLKIEHLQINKKEQPFVREQHLIVINPDVEINSNEQFTLDLSYSGIISENLCYLDILEKERQKKHNIFVLNIDKRYAFSTPEYVLLTPEVNWYPQVGVTYSNKNVHWSHPEFINFTLEVKTRPSLQAISQGKITTLDTGHFLFNNAHPLPQISLAIGNYEKKTLQTKDKEFSIWHIKGHDNFSSSLAEIKDTIPQLIEERLGDFERTYNLEYPFQRLSLVEVPAQFKTHERLWTSCQESVQPGQILIPEKGFSHYQFNFSGTKKNMKRWGRRGNNSMTDEEIEIRVLYNALELFEKEKTNDFRGGRRGIVTLKEDANPLFIFPMLYNFQNNIQSSNWPVTNRIFEAYLKSQSNNIQSGWMRDIQGMSDDELANIALQDSTFKEILANPKQKSIIDNVIKLKGEALFSIIEWKAGQDNFQDFLRQLLKEYRFKNISFENFAYRINSNFKINLIPIMDNWFKEKELPGYLFSPIDAVKVKSGNRIQTKVSLKATNFSKSNGIIKFTFRIGQRGGRGGRIGRSPDNDNTINKLVYLKAGQTKEINFLLDTEPRMVAINTMASQNIPQMITHGFRKITEDNNAEPIEGERIINSPVKKEMPGEIIIDNENILFEVTENTNVSLLEKWMIKKDKPHRKYSGISYWRPPFNWTAITNSDLYGEYIRSGYYIKSGDGSMKAKWKAPISSPGYYDLYYHIFKSERNSRRGGEHGEYQFFIHSNEGTEEQSLSYQNAEAGWNHLGSYYFASDTALIELTNKSELRIVFADAIKLIKL